MASAADFLSPSPRSVGAGAFLDQPQPSPLGYIGSRFLGGLLEGGKALGTAASLEMGQLDQAQELQNMPGGQETADRAIYGAPGIQAPGPISRYAGSVASAAGSNPVLAAIAPGYTAAGAVGSEGASDINTATGSHLPDWLARFLGGLAGGGVYGAGKAAAGKIAGAVSGGDEAIQRGRDVMSRIQAGEGRLGEFQKQAQDTRAALQQASADMPQVPDTHLVDVKSVKDFTESPESAFIPGIDRIQKSIGTVPLMPYGQLSRLMDEAGSAGQSTLYNTLKAAKRAAIVDVHGPEASALFDKANAARQALYVLDKSVDPSGLYNPLALTRKLAVHPGAGTVADATPEMTALTDRASDLYNMVSPVTKANMPRPGILSRFAPPAAALLAGHAGVPGADTVAGFLLGHADRGAVNPLYTLPGGHSLLGATNPLLAGGGLSLLNQSTRPNSGLLGP